MLTYNRKYEVLDSNERDLLVENDAGNMKWYPTRCFDLSGADVPCIASYQIENPLPSESPVEVTVQLSDGRKRWCWFATPGMLERCGDVIPGTAVRVHYGRHMIVTSELSEPLIQTVLGYLERQGELVDHTTDIE
jgi:hypothetical protein